MKIIGVNCPSGIITYVPTWMRRERTQVCVCHKKTYLVLDDAECWATKPLDITKDVNRRPWWTHVWAKYWHKFQNSHALHHGLCWESNLSTGTLWIKPWYHIHEYVLWSSEYTRGASRHVTRARVWHVTPRKSRDVNHVTRCDVGFWAPSHQGVGLRCIYYERTYKIILI